MKPRELYKQTQADVVKKVRSVSLRLGVLRCASLAEEQVALQNWLEDCWSASSSDSEATSPLSSVPSTGVPLSTDDTLAINSIGSSSIAGPALPVALPGAPQRAARGTPTLRLCNALAASMLDDGPHGAQVPGATHKWLVRCQRLAYYGTLVRCQRLAR